MGGGAGCSEAMAPSIWGATSEAHVMRFPFHCRCRVRAAAGANGLNSAFRHAHSMARGLVRQGRGMKIVRSVRRASGAMWMKLREIKHVREEAPGADAVAW